MTKHFGQSNVFGLFPSNQYKLAHLPHNIEVLIGSTRVVSTLYMIRPESGILERSGSHAAIFSGSTLSSSLYSNPTNNNISPNTAIGAANDNIKARAS